MNESINEQREQPTPGPWRWFDYPDGRKLLCAKNGAVVHCPDAPMSVTYADSVLIAAAPDLLDALRQARREYGVSTTISGETLVQMDAAISRAEG